MTINIKEKIKEIQMEQENSYILASILNLVINRTNMNDEEVEEFLEAVKGGWY